MSKALRLAPLAVLAVAMAAKAGAGGASHFFPGVDDPGAARIDYVLKCQGCHRPDGTGNAANTPPLAGEVARFLAVPGGREFLARVPGVASVDLDDRRTARVLNYTLFRFDREHLPDYFRPYTAEEIRRLRGKPIRLERAAERARLIALIETTGEVSHANR